MKAFWIILIVVLMAAPAAFWFFSQNDNTQPQATAVATGAQATQASGDAGGESSSVAKVSGEDILKSLARLKKVEPKISFFQDIRFDNLVDYSVTPPEIILGRFNPFAPISSVSAVVATSTSVTLFGR